MLPNELVLQFSTAAPDWRKWSPHFVRRDSGLPCLLFDKNWGSSLIRRACHSPFSHCDIVLSDGNLLGASDYPTAPIIAGNSRGVAVRPPDYSAFRYRKRMVLETLRADDVRCIALTQLGKPFDNGALRDFLSDSFPGSRDWRIDDCWFCAELVAWAMEVGGMWPQPLAWPKNRVSPTDILLLFLTDSRWVNRDTFWQ